MLPTIALLALHLLPAPLQEDSGTREGYIYDPQIQQFILESGIAMIAADAYTPNATLQEQLSSRRTIDMPPPAAGSLTRNGRDIYDKACAATIIIVNLTPLEGVEGEYVVGQAGTGFLISEDGLAVTNYHVMMQEAATTYIAMTRDGRVVPVVEVLSGLREHDLAVIRLADPQGQSLPFMPIARDAEVGERVHVIGHPGHRFWRYSAGHIARFHAANVLVDGPVVTRMDVTAEFALGSSGGPVINDDGQVVGVVASTQVMYDPSGQGEVPAIQLVFRDCVPYETLLDLFVGE